MIQIAREFAQNAVDTNGRSMIIMGAGINHWYNEDTIDRAILNLVLLTGSQGVNGGGWAHYVGQEKVHPAINPPWESKSDWDIFKDLANSFSTMAETHIPERNKILLLHHFNMIHRMKFLNHLVKFEIGVKEKWIRFQARPCQSSFS